MSTIDLTSGEIFSGTLGAGDTLVVENGGQTAAAQIYGTEIIEAGGNSNSDTVYAGGLIVAERGSDFGSATIAGGTVDLTADGNDSADFNSINFTGPGGVLEVNATEPVESVAGITPFIDHIDPGDAVSIAELPTNDLSYHVVGENNVIIEGSDANGTEQTELYIQGAAQDSFEISDTNDVATLECVCFLAGTAISTLEGDRAIETLVAGDLVLTANSVEMPVRWLGRQTVVTDFAEPYCVAPIRIRMGALDENLPRRDLLISSDHALLVDGVFVQAGALVNGVSILREMDEMPKRFVYFHLELADHSLILAEGVACETFIDNVDRRAFDNWGEHALLEDDAARISEMSYARAKSHRQVPQVLRARLMARGLELFGGKIAAIA